MRYFIILAMWTIYALSTSTASAATDYLKELPAYSKELLAARIILEANDIDAGQEKIKKLVRKVGKEHGKNGLLLATLYAQSSNILYESWLTLQGGQLNVRVRNIPKQDAGILSGGYAINSQMAKLHKLVTLGNNFTSKAIKLAKALDSEEGDLVWAKSLVEPYRYWSWRSSRRIFTRSLKKAIELLERYPSEQTLKLIAHAALANLYLSHGLKNKANKQFKIIQTSARSLETTVPILLHAIKPNFPKEALAADSEGYARIGFTINKEGAAVQPIILESVGHEKFGVELLKVAKYLRYAPQFHENHPIEVSNQSIKFTFELIY